MYLNIQPELRTLWFNDVDIGSVDGAHTARGRLAILLYLVRDEHGLLSGGGEASLPGKLGDEVPDTIMAASVKALGATCSVPAIRV